MFSCLLAYALSGGSGDAGGREEHPVQSFANPLFDFLSAMADEAIATEENPDEREDLTKKKDKIGSIVRRAGAAIAKDAVDFEQEEQESDGVGEERNRLQTQRGESEALTDDDLRSSIESVRREISAFREEVRGRGRGTEREVGSRQENESTHEASQEVTQQMEVEADSSRDKQKEEEDPDPKDKSMQIQRDQKSELPNDSVHFHLPKWIFVIIIGCTGIFSIVVIIIVIVFCRCQGRKAHRSDATKSAETAGPKLKTSGGPIITKPINEWKSTKMTQKGSVENLKSDEDDDNEDLFEEGFEGCSATERR